jgi:hypothetical protein
LCVWHGSVIALGLSPGRDESLKLGEASSFH